MIPRLLSVIMFLEIVLVADSDIWIPNALSLMVLFSILPFSTFQKKIPFSDCMRELFLIIKYALVLLMSIAEPEGLVMLYPSII